MSGIKTREYKRRCAHAVTVVGEVTASEYYETDYGEDADGFDDSESHYSVTYKYTYMDQTYHHTSSLDTDRQIGEKEELEIYALDPTVVLSDGNPGIIFMVLGIICSIPLVLALGFLLFKGSFFSVMFGLGAVGFLIGAATTGKPWGVLVAVVFGGVALLFGGLMGSK